MKKLYRLAVLFIIILLSFSGCKTLPTPSRMIKAPEAAKQTVIDNNVEDIAVKLLPKDGKLITPKNPKSVKAVQRVDIDEDGKDEIFATYRVNGEKMEVVAVLFGESDGVWKEQWRISSPGYEFDWAGFANLTDLKQMELIIGVDPTGGASSAKGAKIFTMEADKPKEIYSTLYRDIEVICSDTTSTMDNADRLALWFKPGPFSSTVEAYKLEKINDEYILMPNSEDNQYFIKNVLPQYEAKMDMLTQIRDNWIYFYYYADVMIKVDDPVLALGAIENGIDRVDSSNVKANIKLLLLKARAFNEAGNSKRALEVLENTMQEIKSLQEDELAAGFEALLYLELVNTHNMLKDTDKAEAYYGKALEAGKKACNQRAYENVAQSNNVPFYEHYLKVESIEKDFKAKFIYSVEKR